MQHSFYEMTYILLKLSGDLVSELDLQNLFFFLLAVSKAGEISVSGYEDEGLPFEEVVGEYKCLARSVLGNHSTTFRLLKEKNTQPTYKNQDNSVHDNPGDEAGVNLIFNRAFNRAPNLDFSSV